MKAQRQDLVKRKIVDAHLSSGDPVLTLDNGSRVTFTGATSVDVERPEASISEKQRRQRQKAAKARWEATSKAERREHAQKMVDARQAQLTPKVRKAIGKRLLEARLRKKSV